MPVDNLPPKNMFSLMKDLDHFKLIWSDGDVRIDTFAASLHHRFTVILLLVFCTMVSNWQYFGHPIECIQDINNDRSPIPLHVMNTFCFVSSTYTIPKIKEDTGLLPNLGPDFDTSIHSEIRHHAYYQWIPLVLLLQAVLFKLPHIGWQNWEGRLMHGMTNSIKDDRKVNALARYFVLRINTHCVWLTGFIFYEIFNFLNLLGNILITQYLLGGLFFSYGVQIMRYFLGPSFKNIDIDFFGFTSKNPADLLFPKITKCAFYKYGASGTIQRHDFMCIMSMNVVNEKIFAVLWFWYLILLMISSFSLLWRLFSFLTVLCFSGSESGLRNKIVTFVLRLPEIDDPLFFKLVGKKFFYSDWMLLSSLSQNLSSSTFSKLRKEIVKLH